MAAKRAQLCAPRCSGGITVSYNQRRQKARVAYQTPNSPHSALPVIFSPTPLEMHLYVAPFAFPSPSLPPLGPHAAPSLSRGVVTLVALGPPRPQAFFVCGVVPHPLCTFCSRSKSSSAAYSTSGSSLPSPLPAGLATCRPYPCLEACTYLAHVHLTIHGS